MWAKTQALNLSQSYYGHWIIVYEEGEWMRKEIMLGMGVVVPCLGFITS